MRFLELYAGDIDAGLKSSLYKFRLPEDEEPPLEYDDISKLLKELIIIYTFNMVDGR
jgi:hypothetical protein